VAFEAMGVSTVGVLATNTSDMAKSFTVKATYKAGSDIVATAVGAVNGILPGQRRAVTLISDTSPIPQHDAVSVQVDTMVGEGADIPGVAAEEKLKFGKPAVKSQSGLTSVNVEVTNAGSDEVSLTVGAAFLKGDKLIGIGTGAVNNLGAGQTKTATLLVQGSAKGYDKVLVYPDTVL
jgi:hypothetical protein